MSLSFALEVILSRILVVEDDVVIRRLTADLLREEGHEVHEANGGEVGLEAIDAAVAGNDPFALVVLDMRMPGMDGRQFAAALAERNVSIPILLMTASHDVESAAVEIQADAYVAKPFDIDELIAQVDDLTSPDFVRVSAPQPETRTGRG
ncbi:MAG: response regulator [Dehalococcoidia bacterium]